MTIADLELARLLCTRLCHDLAGPVGAVSAGVELIGDDPSQVDEETLALIGDSSTAASRKLRFLRAALGVANGSADEVEELLNGYLGAMAGMGGKVEVSWPAPAVLSVADIAQSLSFCSGKPAWLSDFVTGSERRRIFVNYLG